MSNVLHISDYLIRKHEAQAQPLFLEAVSREASGSKSFIGDPGSNQEDGHGYVMLDLTTYKKIFPLN